MSSRPSAPDALDGEGDAQAIAARGLRAGAAWRLVSIRAHKHHRRAARAALSPYHFARAFKTAAGTTPRAFVEERRIERAKQLLADSDQPIASIAADTGFGRESRLTSIFRRQTGFTPAVYRRGRAGSPGPSARAASLGTEDTTIAQ